MLWINHMLNLLWRYTLHVFMYFWALVVAHIASELTVIAGVSRTGFCFKILSPTVLSAVPEYCFFHFSSLWHLTEGINLMLPLMLLWGLAGSERDWWPHHSSQVEKTSSTARENVSHALLRGGGRSALCFVPRKSITSFWGESRDRKE